MPIAPEITTVVGPNAAGKTALLHALSKLFGVSRAPFSVRTFMSAPTMILTTCPVNMSGGLIGCRHPVGATGARLLFDAASQITNTAGECQIENAQRMQTLNIGGSCATLVGLVVARA